MEVEMGKSLRWKRVIVAVNSGRVRSVRCRARLVGPDRLLVNMLGKTVQCSGLVGVRTLDPGMPEGVSRMVVLHLGCRHGGLERTRNQRRTLDVAARSHGNVDRML